MQVNFPSRILVDYYQPIFHPPAATISRLPHPPCTHTMCQHRAHDSFTEHFISYSSIS